MIIKDCNVFVDVVLDGNRFCHLGLVEVENLLKKYKSVYNNLKPKEIMTIPNCFAYFCCDGDNNRFTCKIYKTSYGSDRWIMLMKDSFEGYALYRNPVSGGYELAWYHSELEKPLTESEEKEMITCYVPG